MDHLSFDRLSRKGRKRRELARELAVLQRRIADFDRREEDRVRAMERAAHLGRILDESLNEIYSFHPGTLRFTRVNRGARENLGYTMEELLGLTPLDVMPEFTPASFAKLLVPLLHSKAPRVCFPTLHRRKDGSTYSVDVDLQLSTDGPRKEFLAIALDTSARRRAEAALRESESRLRAILEESVEGIVCIDERGSIELVNSAARAMFGYQRDEMLGGSVTMLMPEPYRSEHASQIAKYLATGEKRVIGIGREVEGQRKDGTKFPLYLSVAEAASGGKRTFTGVLRDLTPVKRAEEELRSVQRQLYHAQKIEAIGQVAGEIAHDFNNHLTVILGHAELLAQRARGDAPLEQALAEIIDAAKESAALTQQLLAFGRKQILEPGPVDLNQLLARMERMLHAMLGGHVRVEWERAPDLSPIISNRDQMEQVIVNLAVNALDAMQGSGKLTIATANVVIGPDEAKLLPGTSPGPYVRLTVADDGRGMDAATRSNIFEPFFTTKPGPRGTGLGLATVYGIVKQAGGAIAVESEVERGTAFRLYFPAALSGGTQPC